MVIYWAQSYIVEIKSQKLYIRLGPKGNVDKTKYVLMFHDQISGQNSNIKIVNELFEYTEVLGIA